MMEARPGRVLVLDVGSARVGAAISDPMRLIAQGLAVWPVVDRDGGWRRKFEACLVQYTPTLVLVGMPTRTDGTRGPEAERVAKLVDLLRAGHPDLAFDTWDERFTTVIAHQAMIECGVSRSGRRQRVDKIAAVLILESWLARQAAP